LNPPLITYLFTVALPVSEFSACLIDAVSFTNGPYFIGTIYVKFEPISVSCKSRDSPVGIATDYGLDDPMIGARIRAGAGNFPLLHRLQTGSGAHPASHPMGTGGSFSGGKAAGA
jgi:hypothetical protein